NRRGRCRTSSCGSRAGAVHDTRAGQNAEGDDKRGRHHSYRTRRQSRLVARAHRYRSLHCEEPRTESGGRTFASKPAAGGRIEYFSSRPAGDYLILASLNTTCLRTTGSNFFSSSLLVLVRGFFFVT